jgi:hypothetical protein
MIENDDDIIILLEVKSDSKIVLPSINGFISKPISLKRLVDTIKMSNYNKM